jgi:hypothetical protein
MGSAMRDNRGAMPASADDPLARQVYVGDRYKPFGEMTAEDARSQAAGLSGVSGGGLEARVAPVATGWRQLAKLLDDRGLETVSELGREEAERLARKVWVVPPRGSLL